MLSTEENTTIKADDLTNGYRCNVNLSRAELEDLIKPVTERCQTELLKAIQEAGVDRQTIKTALLVGGSTQIPRFTHLMNEQLAPVIIRTAEKPDEILVFGAACRAA